MYFCSVLSDSLWGKCYISVKYQGSEIYLIVSVCVGSILIGGTFVCVMTLLLIAKNGGDPFQYLVIVVDPRAFAATALALVGKQATQRYEGYTFFYASQAVLHIFNEILSISHLCACFKHNFIHMVKYCSVSAW